MNILKGMSFRPGVMRAFLELNREINFEPAGIDRIDRELIAVVVSVANGCRYSTHAQVDLLRAEGAPPGLVDAALAEDARTDLSPARRALCSFAWKLTLTPSEIGEPDVQALRSQGYDDAAIHDGIQVVAFFNYVNRVVNAVGVDDEPEWAAEGG
jgi:uncharacterized peroxidase-related enzyme